MKLHGDENYPSLGKLGSNDLPSPEITISHSPIKYSRMINKDLEFNINPMNKQQKSVTTKNSILKSKGTGVTQVFRNPQIRNTILQNTIHKKMLLPSMPQHPFASSKAESNSYEQSITNAIQQKSHHQSSKSKMMP